jgi:hypothetical protein
MPASTRRGGAGKGAAARRRPPAKKAPAGQKRGHKLITVTALATPPAEPRDLRLSASFPPAVIAEIQRAASEVLD